MWQMFEPRPRHRKTRFTKVQLRQVLAKRTYVDTLRQGPCSECHQQYHRVCMDFDHIPGRGNKKITISHLVNSTASMAALKRELEKCELVCSNCHRIREARRKGII